MTDIKTAMATALKEWGQTEGTVTEAPAPERNLTRDTFNMVRDNRGILRIDATCRLEAMGYKTASITAIISQMIRAKMVLALPYYNDYTLSTQLKEYVPLTGELKKLAKVHKVTKGKPKVTKAAPHPQATLAPAPGTQRVSMSVDEWLDGMPVKQAYEAYLQLRNIFGGQK